MKIFALVFLVACQSTSWLAPIHSVASPTHDGREYHSCAGGGACLEGYSCVHGGYCEWCGDYGGEQTKCTSSGLDGDYGDYR